MIASLIVCHEGKNCVFVNESEGVGGWVGTCACASASACESTRGRERTCVVSAKPKRKLGFLGLMRKTSKPGPGFHYEEQIEDWSER